MSMMLVMAAMGAANMHAGRQKARNEKRMAHADYLLEKSKAQSDALSRAGANILSMENANTARFNQWRNNNKGLESMGEALSQASYNLNAQLGSIRSAKFEEQLQNATYAGTVMAQAGASGVGGSSVEQLMQAERIRAARQEQAFSDAEVDAKHVSALNQVSIMDNTFSSMDFRAIYSGMDYTPEASVIDQSKWMKYTLANAAMDFSSGFQGNMGNLGINLQDHGFKGKGLFDWSGSDNKGLGGGGSAPIYKASPAVKRTRF